MKECESYETNVLEIAQELVLKQKDGGILPTHAYRSAIERFSYDIRETIGEGTFSKVKRAYCKKLQTDVAIKIIQKGKLPKDAREKFLQREIALLQKLRHNTILVLHEVYESRCNLYLVTEYLPNGDLLDYINTTGSLSEADGRRIFHQLLDAVTYLHGHHVYHRDIKLDNILLDDCFNIRLADFGFARYNPTEELMSTYCGSYAYAAPELLDGEPYEGDKADIWATGVCLYGMLNGKLPFRDDDIDILRNTIDEEKIKFYKQVSKDCRHVIRWILSCDPEGRPRIVDIRQSDWMCKPITNTNDMSMSQYSVRAVTTDVLTSKIDPQAEHGFTCNQNSKEVKSTKVTDILRSVAVNHSTGSSSISLPDVLPANKVSSVGMMTGVRGPAGRRISVQLGVADFGGLPSKKTPLGTISESPKQNGSGEGNKTNGGALAKFRKAAGALNRFKTAVRVVAAMRKFKRGPLNTILTIPQEQAMAKVINNRENQTEHEMKEVKFASSAKVADALGSSKREKTEARRQKQEQAEMEKRKRNDLLKEWGDTFSHLGA